MGARPQRYGLSPAKSSCPASKACRSASRYFPRNERPHREEEAALGGDPPSIREVVKKPTALGISHSGGARNPHVFQHTLRLLVPSMGLTPSGLTLRFAPGETVLRSGGRDLPSLATVFSQTLRHARGVFRKSSRAQQIFSNALSTPATKGRRAHRGSTTRAPCRCAARVPLAPIRPTRCGRRVGAPHSVSPPPALLEQRIETTFQVVSILTG